MLISGLTLISRVAGLLRDAICARAFGAGPIWSSFALAFMLPNLFRRLFGEGALSAALIPEYTKTHHADPEQARRLANATTQSVMAILAIACVCLELLILALLSLTPLGTHGTLTLQLAMVMLPFAMLICVTAALGGMLQCHNVFGPTAAAPIILNCCIIAGVLLSLGVLDHSRQTAIFVVAGAVVIAGCIQVVWSWIAIRRVAGWTWDTTGTRTQLRSMARTMMPVIVGMGTIQLNTLFDGLLAGWPVLVGPELTLPLVGTHAYPLDQDANAVLFYAQRLYQFPLGVFGIALATAVFPTLARHASDREQFLATLRKGARLACFIAIPASVGIIAVRTDLIRLLFQGGQFDASDSQRVSQTLLAYAPAIWAATASHTLTRAFYARGETRTPMRVAMLAVCANVVLDLVLIAPLKEAGLALATSISALLQVALLWLLLRRSLGPILKRNDTRALACVLAASAIMGGVLLLSGLGFVAPQDGESALGTLGRLAACVALGGAVYAALARLCSLDELGWLLNDLRKRKSDDSR
jgi:putative peptidoglycan lipid II flippase